MTADINNLRNLLSFVSRSSLAAFFGKTFGGARDLNAALGYKTVLRYQDYQARYERGGVAQRVVDAMPRATWRNPPTVVANEGRNDTRFDKAWEELAKRLKMFHYMERVDRVAGIGQYGVMLLGVRGARSFEEPIQRVRGPEDILYLAPYSEDNSKIHSFDNDETSERFGLPFQYEITTTRDITSAGMQGLSTAVGQTVMTHYSRLIHVADNLLEDDIFGQPRMKAVWNYLDDLDKTAGASSEAIWKTMDRGIQFDLDPELDLSPEDEAALSDEIKEYMHGQQRFLQTRGIEAKVLETSNPDPEPNFRVLASLIAGTTGIPQRILFGSERGQLASSQDEKAFNSRIKERQESYAEPLILRPVVDTLIDINALPNPRNGYKVEWPDLSVLTLKEKADVAARNGQAAEKLAIIMEKRPFITVGESREMLGLPAEPPGPLPTRPKPLAPPVDPNRTPSDASSEEA